jgi:acetolactate synthase I/II/III large subunit
MTVAEFIAGQLYNAGVRYVFGIPGGPSIPYLKAFREAGIEFILTSHEASAGIMAGVMAGITGIPGVCHATFGPGATNISTGAGNALLDRSPVIILTSEINDMMVNRTVQMNINHQQLFAPLTKATFRLNPENVQEILDRALKISCQEFPGPVHIGLPDNIADREILPPSGTFSQVAPNKPVNDLNTIITILEKSRRPIISVGLTARRLHLGPAILSFLDSYNIPVVITPMAKGLIPEGHPSYTGVLFHALSDILEDITEKCDLVIGLGYDPVEFNYESWMPGVPLIHFSTIESDLPENGMSYQFTGKPEEWFDVLKNIRPGSLLMERSAIKGIRDEMASIFEGLTNHFGPVSAMKVLREELPDNAILTADVGSHLHVAGQYWEVKPGGDLIISNGWSGMGFAIPAAMAAVIACPGRTVACITGDGGFLMAAGEIATARRYGLPVIIIVFSDGELNLIKIKQSWKGLDSYGTDLYEGDLFESGSFLGVKIFTAITKEDMREAVKAALAIKEPVIINAVIDPDDYNSLIVKR